MNTTPCPACADPRLQPFYDGGLVPVHSTLLMRSKDMALRFPRGRLDLARCAHCGFISNTAFEAGRQAYSGECEESQGCSPTFSRWLTGLADQLVENHGFSGRRILEIGCGKGEFLVQLCQRDDNTGIGFDPAFVPGRQGEQLETVEFRREFWSRKHGLMGAEAVVCRHTLEHIHDVLEFLGELRASIGDRTGIPVFFEVPDTDRVLREGAFWDIYYEHCSYFSRDNLCALFQRSGFDVEKCWLDYNDQYLMVLARPVTSGHGAIQGAPVSGNGRGSQSLEDQRGRWAQSLAGWRREGLEVVLWGGGSKAVAFLNTLESSALVSRVIDINPHKQGAYIPGTGQRVVAPEDLADRPADLVILMNPVYEPEVRASLQRLGSEAELRSLG